MDDTITPPAEEYLISIDYPTREETSEVIAAIKTIKATALDCVITAEARRDQMLDAIRDMYFALKFMPHYLHHVSELPMLSFRCPRKVTSRWWQTTEAFLACPLLQLLFSTVNIKKIIEPWIF